MKNIVFSIVIAGICGLQACLSGEQNRFNNRMEGTWQMDETVILINQDGSTTPVSETPAVGTLLLQSNGASGIAMDYSLTLTNSTYTWEILPFKTDEDNKRVFFYYFFCNEIFGCDLVATIEKNERNLQQWSWVRPAGNGQHKKVTWVLKKQ
jgi:hypothetical protein